MEEAIRSRKPTLINAVIDETAGTESGRITSLNPERRRKNDANARRRQVPSSPAEFLETEWKH